MTEEVVDHEARSQAKSAMQAINAHERHCGERWGQARAAADKLTNTVTAGFRTASESDRRLHQRIDRIIWAVAIGAVAMLANAGVLLVMQ